MQFGVRVLPGHLGRERAKMLPNNVRYTNENRHIQELQPCRLGPVPYTMQPPEIVELLLKCSQKDGVPLLVVPKAPDPRQRSKQGHFWLVAVEGPSPLTEISLLNGKVFLTREGVQEKGNNKVRPKVCTKL